MMRRIVAIATWVLVCAAVPAVAQEDLITDFVGGNGFVPVDADLLWQGLNAALAADEAEPSVFWPAAHIGPMPLAVLAMEAEEAPLERVRYRIRYGVAWFEEMPGAAAVPYSFTEVTRFNLGPAIRQDLVESLGEDAVAAPEAFGMGPHVAWRLVTRPLMGNRALIMAAGRAELAEDSALESLCLGHPCLSTALHIEELVPWSEPQVATLPETPDWVREAGDVTPASAVESMLGAIEIEQAGDPETPSAMPDWVIEAVVEWNLGQDQGLDAAYRWGGFLDDSVAAEWRRLVSFDQGPDLAPAVMEAVSYECRRGPAFPEPGQYCL